MNAMLARFNLFMTNLVYAIHEALYGFSDNHTSEWRAEVERLEKIINERE